MTKSLTNRKQTDKFLKKVLGDADHHAKGMIGPVRTLYNYMIERIKFERDLVEVYEREGVFGRTTWITLSDSRMVFSYNYDRKCITLKSNSSRGEEVASFVWNEDRSSIEKKLSDALKTMGVSC